MFHGRRRGRRLEDGLFSLEAKTGGNDAAKGTLTKLSGGLLCVAAPEGLEITRGAEKCAWR